MERAGVVVSLARSRQFGLTLAESSSIAFHHAGFVDNQIDFGSTIPSRSSTQSTKMAPPKKLTFNFSSEPTPDNYIRKPAVTPRRKQAEVVEDPAIVVDDDKSPLFVPLSQETPDQTEVSQHPYLSRPVFCTHRLATGTVSTHRRQRSTGVVHQRKSELNAYLGLTFSVLTSHRWDVEQTHPKLQLAAR